ncbi:hypothetical protein ANO14919_058270 [Xylariales sp. No.14919]|nr:hypothetical protein ANO14919_058270 [Xylariales sp. No.14919]
MRKAVTGARVSPAPSPQPQTAEGTFSADPLRYASAAAQSRAPSSTSIRRDSPLPRNDHNTPSSSMRSTPRPPPTRTSSTNTALFTTRNLGGATKGSGKSSTDAQRRLTSLPITTNVDDQDDQEDQGADLHSPGLAESSSATSSSDESSPAQSRIIRRPPRFQGNEGPSFANDDDDDDDDAEPAFLPYRLQSGVGTSGQHDMSATLRGNFRDSGKRSMKGSDRGRTHHSQTSDSSTSSAPLSRGANDRPSGPLSPRRTMELSGRSPGGKLKGHSRDSDGTPSMGSSYSDLDDASVTQSALEAEFASRMQDNSTISIFRGTISNAFRSGYRTRSNNAP